MALRSFLPLPPLPPLPPRDLLVMTVPSAQVGLASSAQRSPLTLAEPSEHTGFPPSAQGDFFFFLAFMAVPSTQVGLAASAHLVPLTLAEPSGHTGLSPSAQVFLALRLPYFFQSTFDFDIFQNKRRPSPSSCSSSRS